MKVGLTGFQGTPGDPGFIGGWLTGELESHGHQVVALFGDVRKRWSYWRDDMSDPWLSPPDMLQGVDVVVHLAALVGRERFLHTPADVVQTNAYGTLNVAEACHRAGVRLLYVSTSEAAYSHRNLYGLTKAWGEDAARMVFSEWADQLKVARLFMPYGPGHVPGKGRAALTNWCWQALTGERLTVHDGTSRSWCWVGDTVAGLRQLVEDWPAGRTTVWNIGREDNSARSIDVARQVLRQVAGCAPGTEDAHIDVVPAPEGIVPKKLPDTLPLRRLGWAPLVELDEGINRTAAWLREWDGREDDPGTVLRVGEFA